MLRFLAMGEIRDFAARYTAAWCSQRPAEVAGFFSEEGTLRVNDGVAAVGRKAVAEVAESFMTAFPDLTVVMDDVLLKAGWGRVPLDSHRHKYRGGGHGPAGSD